MKINFKNYEEWMVAFLDDELSADELLIFNQFIEKNPELKSELVEFESTILIADENIVFENKERLFKSSALMITLKKAWPIAAAIVLLLALIPFLKNETVVQPTVVSTQDPLKAVTPTEVASKPITAIEAIIEKKQPQPTNRPSNSASKKVVAKSTQIKKSSMPVLKDEQVLKELITEKKQVEIIAKEDKLKQAPTPKPIVEKKIETPLEKVIIHAPEEIIVHKNIPARRGLPVFKINEENNAALHQKLNEVVTLVEDKIEFIKDIKRAPITVCIGNKKIFTLNN